LEVNVQRIAVKANETAEPTACNALFSAVIYHNLRGPRDKITIEVLTSPDFLRREHCYLVRGFASRAGVALHG